MKRITCLQACMLAIHEVQSQHSVVLHCSASIAKLECDKQRCDKPSRLWNVTASLEKSIRHINSETFQHFYHVLFKLFCFYSVISKSIHCCCHLNHDQRVGMCRTEGGSRAQTRCERRWESCSKKSKFVVKSHALACIPTTQDRSLCRVTVSQWYLRLSVASALTVD